MSKIKIEIKNANTKPMTCCGGIFIHRPDCLENTKQTPLEVPKLLCKGCQARQNIIASLSAEVDRQRAQITELEKSEASEIKKAA